MEGHKADTALSVAARLLIACLGLLAYGCKGREATNAPVNAVLREGAKVATLEDLRSRMNTARTIWKGIFYAGSEGPWHYFVDTPGGATIWIAIDNKELSVTKPMSVASRRDWIDVTYQLMKLRDGVDIRVVKTDY